MRSPDAPDRRRHQTFRFAASTVERLEARARRVGQPRARLAERYVDEGLRLDEHPGIAFRDAAGGRRPALAGTRLDVSQVIETVKGQDQTAEEAAAYLAIPVERVRAAIRYYAAFKEEVDAWAQEAWDAASEEEARDERERAAIE